MHHPSDGSPARKEQRWPALDRTPIYLRRFKRRAVNGSPFSAFLLTAPGAVQVGTTTINPAMTPVRLDASLSSVRSIEALLPFEG